MNPTTAAAAAAIHAPLASMHIIVVAVLALLAIVAVIVLHRLRLPLPPEGQWGVAAVRLGIAVLAWWFTVALLSRKFLFTTDWPLPFWCFVGAAAMEALIALYRYERRTMSPLTGNTLLGLRLALLALILIWLTQPVLHKEMSKPILRYVAVLIDDSASMKLIDKDATPRERLELAQLFGVPLQDRPEDFLENRQQLEALNDKFSAQLKLLELIEVGNFDAGQGSKQLSDRLAKLKELSGESSVPFTALNKSITQLDARKLPLDTQASALLAGTTGRLKALREGPLSRMENQTAKGMEAPAVTVGRLRDDTRAVVEGLRQVGDDLEKLPHQLDDAYWRSLPAAKRLEIQQRTDVAREEIVKRVLERKGKDDKALVKELDDGYTLKFYRFASQPLSASKKDFIAGGKDEAPAAEKAGDAAKPDADKAKTAAADPKADKAPPVKREMDAVEQKSWRSSTDMTAALKQVTDDTKLEELSGVLIISDGRHNVDDPLAPILGKLASQHVPVSSIVIGSHHVPKDAAVAGVETAETTLLGDKLSVKASLKLDGYRGETVAVRLMKGTEQVDRKTVNVPEEHFRTKVEFSQPTKEAGTFGYRVEVVAADGSPLKETVLANNSLERQVTVSDDRVKLLVIDSAPRWEFRYLKNLFSGPDKKVLLQYVLTNPTRLAEAPPGSPIHASATRPFGQFQADLLPENEQEWLKFDVIVLGDVPPSVLDEKTLKILDKFVSKRGGTLVVVAGADNMPHAYADTVLAKMLPVRSEKVTGNVRQTPDPGYRLRLTADGREHQVMRQASGTDSEDLWKSMPVLRWRHSKIRAKEGATVLAYAESAYGDSGRGSRGMSPEEEARKQRDNALISTQQYGAGKVLVLSFDETWRLRYRVGVAYHHRFWGQVVRWGADDKLPSGGALVRLGTDRPRYETGQNTIIKARLLDEKGDPVVKDDVVAKVYRGDKLLHTISMAADKEVPGRYQADVGAKLDTGIYRIELSGPTVDDLVTRDDGKKVATDVAVSDAKTTSELVELTADDTVPTQIAVVTHGKVVPPVQAASLLEFFGPRSGSMIEAKDFRIWDWWPLLVLFLFLGSVEWILRKKVGLT